MSDQNEDPDGTSDEVTGATGEQQVGAWSAPARGPRWSEIASEAEAARPAAAGTGPAQPAEPGPATEAARARRPTSLRSDAAPPADVPGRRLARPSFANRSPASESTAESPVAAPDASASVSESSPAGRSGQVSSSASSLLEKLPVGQLQTLVKQRPEVGIGLAFAGGLVIATIVRRLGRR